MLLIELGVHVQYWGLYVGAAPVSMLIFSMVDI